MADLYNESVEIKQEFFLNNPFDVIKLERSGSEMESQTMADLCNQTIGIKQESLVDDPPVGIKSEDQDTADLCSETIGIKQESFLDNPPVAIKSEKSDCETEIQATTDLCNETIGIKQESFLDESPVVIKSEKSDSERENQVFFSHVLGKVINEHENVDKSTSEDVLVEASDYFVNSWDLEHIKKEKDNNDTVKTEILSYEFDLPDLKDEVDYDVDHSGNSKQPLKENEETSRKKNIPRPLTKKNLLEQELQIDLERGEIQDSASDIATSLISKNNLQMDTLILRKEKIKSKILDVLSFLENAKSHEEVDVIEKALCPIKPTLATINYSILETVPQRRGKVNDNKKIIPQRFFHTKKQKRVLEKDKNTF